MVPAGISQFVPVGFEERLDYLFVGFFLNVSDRRGMVRISRDEDRYIIVVVEGEGNQIGDDRRIDPFFNSPFSGFLQTGHVVIAALQDSS